MTICDRCGNSNPENSRFCNSCGSQVETEESHPPAKMVPDEQPCPRCGGGVPPYMDFCPRCATSLRPLRQFHEPERKCPKCGRVLEHGSTVCPVCIWDNKDPINTPSKPTSDRPIIVGILLSAASVLAIISIVRLLVVTDEIPDLAYVDISGFLACCGVIILFGALSCFFGAILSFRRSKYSVVVIAAAFGMLGLGPFYLASLLSLIAMIIAAVSKDDYKS